MHNGEPSFPNNNQHQRVNRAGHYLPAYAESLYDVRLQQQQYAQRRTVSASSSSAPANRQHTGGRRPRNGAEQQRAERNYALAGDAVPPEASASAPVSLAMDLAAPQPLAKVVKKKMYGMFRGRKKRRGDGDGEYDSDEERRKAKMGYDNTNTPHPTVVLDEARRVQHETLAAIDRTERVMHETEAVGHENLTAVATNREQIHEIHVEVERMDSLTKRAGRDIANVARGLARDKCCICLSILILLLVIAVILALVLYDRRGGAADKPLFLNYNVSTEV